MARLPFIWVGLFSLLMVVHVAAAILSDEGQEYCEGEGSICEVYDDLDSECNEQTGAEYYDCICTSGWVRANIACTNCKRSMGESLGDVGPVYSAICKDEDHSIAPLPSSIIEQQKDRNKTVSVPTSTAEESTTTSGTISVDRSYTTLAEEPWTTTLYGIPTVSLPDIGAATETSGSVTARSYNKPFFAVACAAVLAVVWC